MNRGNEKNDIFKDDEDQNCFLKILSQSAKTYHIKLYCFVLMKNHFHLLVETPLGNLSEFMRHFNISYTSHFNRRHDRVGHLYQGRYKSILVQKDSYLTMVSRYIHLNPAKTDAMKSLELDQRLQYLWAYKWSSLPGYLNPDLRLDFVDYDMILAEYGGCNQTGINLYKQQLAEDLNADFNIDKKVIGRSILGDKDFVSFIKDTHLKNKKEREKPGIGEINKYLSQDAVLALLADEFAIEPEKIFMTSGKIRQITMTILYNYAGLNNGEIGKLFAVDYSTVSQSRKRLREKVAKDKSTAELLDEIELKMSKVKICPLF
jgi:REP element-mobilizing transposase RayT